MSGAPPRILLIGHRGQLAWELRRVLPAYAEVVTTGSAPDGPDDVRRLDLRDAAGIDALVDEVRPALVVNAAAYTDVAGAERERDMAAAVNARAPGLLAAAAARVGATLMHFSTDFVFDGCATRPYREDDPTAPLNVYGATKLAGEVAVAAATDRYLVLRTGWLYAARGRNFVRTVLARALAGETLRVVDDQFGAPTSARHLALCCGRIAGHLLDGGGEFARAQAGVYHLSAAGTCSWYQVAARVLARFPRLHANVEPIASAEYPGGVPRPAYSVLASDRARALFGFRQVSWTEQLAAVLEEIDTSPALG